MSMTLLVASLPMVAAHHNAPQQPDSQWPLPLRSYTIPSQSSLPLNHSPNQLPQQRPNNYIPEQANFSKVSDKGSPYQQSEWQFHNSSKSPGNPCPIEGCVKNYSRPSDLKCHLQFKHPEYAEKQGLFEGKYQCDQNNCPARFSRARLLGIHMKKYHPHAKLHYIDATATVSQVAKKTEPPEPLGYLEDEDDNGRQEKDHKNDDGHQKQGHGQDPLPKFSLKFICGEKT